MAPVPGGAAAARQEGDTMIIPVVEERIVDRVVVDRELLGALGALHAELGGRGVEPTREFLRLQSHHLFEHRFCL